MQLIKCLCSQPWKPYWYIPGWTTSFGCVYWSALWRSGQRWAWLSHQRWLLLRLAAHTRGHLAETCRGDKLLSVHCIGCMLQGQYASRCNSENWGHFVPASWSTNSNKLNFMQHDAGTKFCPCNRTFLQQLGCHTRKTVAATCPRYMSPQHVPATCPRNMSPSVCWPLYITVVKECKKNCAYLLAHFVIF